MPNSRCGLSRHTTRPGRGFPIYPVSRTGNQGSIGEGDNTRCVCTHACFVEYQCAGRVVVETDEVERVIHQDVPGVILEYLTGECAVGQATRAGDRPDDVAERGGDGRNQ